MDEANATVIAANLRADLDGRGAELGRAVTPGDVEPATWAFSRRADDISGADYVNAVNTLHHVGRQVARFFLDYDVLLTPTMAKPPLEIGVLDPMREDTDAYFDDLVSFAAFPPLSNVTGAPAMSVPLYWNGDGLPIGAQFVGRFGDEATLFRLAAQLEEAAPWAGRRPEIS
jgi:Asp-tRNA(Asn)/Glu-tRNA(Gln) amidotransferase A subunit family amidase